MATGRAKILEHAAKLRALSTSPNEHEAASAKEKAEHYCQKHGITEAELSEAAARARGPVRRCAGDVGAQWREHLALAVARRHKCRALLARGKLFFDGDAADDALAQFRLIASDIEARCRRAAGAGEEAVWESIFCARAAHEILGTAWDLGHLRDVIRRADAAGQRAAEEILKGLNRDEIVIRDGLVIVSAWQPGNYATMFVGPSPGAKLRHRGDLSSFNDAARLYTWVFEDQPTLDRRLLAFATTDRARCVVVVGNVVQQDWPVRDVGRDVHGEPMSVDFG